MSKRNGDKARYSTRRKRALVQRARMRAVAARAKVKQAEKPSE